MEAWPHSDCFRFAGRDGGALLERSEGPGDSIAATGERRMDCLSVAAGGNCLSGRDNIGGIHAQLCFGRATGADRDFMARFSGISHFREWPFTARIGATERELERGFPN